MSEQTVQGARSAQYPSDWPADIMAGDITLTDPSFLERPNPYYRALREQDPIHFDRALGLYVISRYDDIQRVLRDGVTFSQELGWNRQFAQGYLDELKAILERDGGGYFPEILLLDPPRHTRMRALLLNAFSAHRINGLEPRIGALISERVEHIAAMGQADGINDFAAPLTISIMCEQLGLPHNDEAKKIHQWGRAYTAQLNPAQTRDEMQANAKLICELQQFIIASIEQRRHRRQEDMISDLIYARIEDDENDRLTYAETVALTRGLLLAGNDTTARALAHFLLIIATNPRLADALYAKLDDDRTVVRFIEEVLRIMPPVRGLFRVTTKAVELGGHQLPEGAHLMILFASGNDDAAVFPCPRQFDSARANGTKHLSFGGGIHLCAGISLARMELKLAVREIMTRLKDVRLTIPESAIRFVPSPSIQAIESLPLTFSRRQ